MTEGTAHKLLKKKVKEKYENQGYKVQKEYRLKNNLIVDIYAENESLELEEKRQDVLRKKKEVKS